MTARERPVGTRGHFFFPVWALTLAFSNFFRRFGYFMAGFLAVRRTFLDMIIPPNWLFDAHQSHCADLQDVVNANQADS